MRTYLFALLVVAGCKGKTEEKPKPLVQHKDLGSVEGAKVVEPDVAQPAEPAPPVRDPYGRVHAKPPLWDNAPSGSHMVGDWQVNGFGVGPGFVYGCVDNNVRAAPKDGGAVIERGACGHGYTFLSDGANMFWCDDHAAKTIAPQGEPVSLVDLPDSCIAAAVDETHFYYIVPAFEGVPNAGLYRVAKEGGEPTLLLPTRKGVQLMVALDSDSIWIGSWGAGTIARMKKSGGSAPVVISGQKGIVELLASSEDLYWYSERTKEIRRRSKRGGAITTVANGISNEPIALHDGTLYWASSDTGENGSTSTLYKLRPGSTEPTVIMRELSSPDFHVDDSGVYVGQVDATGIVAIPHTDR